MPYPTIYDAVMAVQERAADRAVVPIENALEGGVAVTLDTLVLEAVDVRIGAELVHPIHHCLIAAEPISPSASSGSSPIHRRSLSARFLRELMPYNRARERALDRRRRGVARRRRSCDRGPRRRPPSCTAAS